MAVSQKSEIKGMEKSPHLLKRKEMKQNPKRLGRCVSVNQVVFFSGGNFTWRLIS